MPLTIEAWQLATGAIVTVLTSTGLSQAVQAIANRRVVQVDSEAKLSSMSLEFAAAVTANADRATANAARAEASATAARAEADDARADAEAARRDLRSCRRAAEEATERMRELTAQVEHMERRMSAWRAAVWASDATVEALRKLIPGPGT